LGYDFLEQVSTATFLHAGAQLAHIQPGTMGSRLMSLGPVRSMYVSDLRRQRIDQLVSMTSTSRNMPASHRREADPSLPDE